MVVCWKYDKVVSEYILVDLKNLVVDVLTVKLDVLLWRGLLC